MSLQTDLIAIVPELIVAAGALIALIVGVCTQKHKLPLTGWLALVLAVAGVAVLFGPDHDTVFHGAFVVDGFTRFAKLLVLGAAALCTLTATRFFADAGRRPFELPVLMALASLGMLVMISAADFLTLYLGLEMQSLALYVLAAFQRDRRSTEAGLKYFVLGALSSGLMLYGISLIYGYAGATGYAMVAVAVEGGASIGLIFGLVFLLAGFAFKLSAVPFHMWAPDVYEGSPTPIAAFFATAAKVAAFAMAIRACLIAFPDAVKAWQQIVLFVAVLSMALGAFAGVAQTNIKRLMAYSAIGHVGYGLLGLAAGSVLGVESMLIYLAFYVVANLGAFAAIQTMRRDGTPVEAISDLAGLARTKPAEAFALAAIMLSLAGLPPLMGIFAKVYVFMAALAAHLYWAAIVGILTSCVAAYYYLRVVKVMYLDEPAPAFDAPQGPTTAIVLYASAAVSVLFVFLPWPLVESAAQAAGALFH